MKNDPENHLPLTAVAYEILLALAAGGQRYGYGIMQAVEESTGGRMTVHPGTLYRALDRLEERGLLVESDERPHPGDDQRRRYYALSELGQAVVRAESVRLAERLSVARSRNLLPEGV